MTSPMVAAIVYCMTATQTHEIHVTGMRIEPTLDNDYIWVVRTSNGRTTALHDIERACNEAADVARPVYRRLWDEAQQWMTANKVDRVHLYGLANRRRFSRFS